MLRWFESYYQEKKVAKAVDLEKIKKRLEGDLVTFFTPWGPRYDWKKRGSIIKSTDREILTLEKISEIDSFFRANLQNKNFQWIILGADLYGTKINNLPENEVKEYFHSLAAILEIYLPGCNFKLWSELEKQAVQIRKKVINNFDELIGPSSVLSRAEKTSALMGGNKQTAKEYIIERITEAILIEEIYQPIKLSIVDKSKDGGGVDRDLPRLYFIKEEFQAPWMRE